MPQPAARRQPIELLESRLILSTVPITVGGRGFDSVQKIAVDSQGDTFVAGIFSKTADFQLGSSNTVLTAVGDSDLFLAKYNPSGKLIWLKQYGGDAGGNFDPKPGDIVNLPINPSQAGDVLTGVSTNPRDLGEYVTGLTVDANDNVYLLGEFRGDVNFDASTTDHILHTNRSYPDIFLLKLSSDGTFQSVHQIGGSFTDVANDMVLDASGNIYLTGYFSRAANFDPSGVRKTDTTDGREDIFVAKYSSSFALDWVSTMGSDETNQANRSAGNGIALGSGGDVYVTGTYAGNTDFDPSASGVLKIDTQGRTDMFLMRLTNAKGALKFVKTIGGDGYDGGVDIAAGPDGTIYTTEYFEDTIDIDPGSEVRMITATPNDPGNNPDQTDLVVTKFSANGNLLFSSQLAGTGYEVEGNMMVDGSGNVTIAGSFWGEADFNPSKAARDKINSLLGKNDFDNDGNESSRSQSYDGFLWKLSTNGKFKNVRRLGGNNDDFITSTALDASGNIEVAGRIITPALLQISGGEVSAVRGPGQADAFTATYDPLFDVLT